MKNIKKTTLSLTFLTLIISVLSIAPFSSAINVESVIGHNFSEEYWAIEFDVLGGVLEEDYTPGVNANFFDENRSDSNTLMDATYYSVYINLGQVQTLFMALTNFSWNNNNPNAYGVAPYQTLTQTFRAPGGRQVFIENTFAGLVAYEENSSNVNGVPDVNDTIYIGNTLNSEYHKHLINSGISEVLGYSPFDEDVIPIVTPIIVNRTETEDEFEYTFGISYENMLVLWHRIDIEDSINENITQSEILLSQIRAISLIESLNFTYKISGIYSEAIAANITTTTEYDIGEMTDFWVINETEATVSSFGGNFFENLVENTSLARYNDSISIQDRLNGTETTPGFSLGLSNYAKINILDAIQEEDEFEILDDENDEINGEEASQNVTKLNFDVLNKPAFLIDFASKPNYTIDGDNNNQLNAPVKLFPNLRVRTPEIGRLATLANSFIGQQVENLVKARVSANVNVSGVSQNRRDVFYIICFPEWNGKSINQDPTFVAISEPDFISDNGRLINGFVITPLILSGLGISLILALNYTKKRRI